MLGLFGAACGYFSIWAFYSFVSRQLVDFFSQLTDSAFYTYDVGLIPFNDIGIILAQIFGGVGLFIGVFGSAAAIRNYLKA